jgi:hypothetical protein
MVELSMVRVTGPLAGHAEGFRAELIRRGYTPRTARDNVYVLAHLSRWLGAEHVEPSGLTPLVVERFLRARRGAGYRRWLTTGSLRALLGYLREVGVAPVWQPPAAEGPVEELLDAYRRYLRVERRLAPRTVCINEEVARRFLSREYRDLDRHLSVVRLPPRQLPRRLGAQPLPLFRDPSALLGRRLAQQPIIGEMHHHPLEAAWTRELVVKPERFAVGLLILVCARHRCPRVYVSKLLTTGRRRSTGQCSADGLHRAPERAGARAGPRQPQAGPGPVVWRCRPAAQLSARVQVCVAGSHLLSWRVASSISGSINARISSSSSCHDAGGIRW